MSLEATLQERRNEAGPEHIGKIIGAADHLERSGVTRGARRIGEIAPDFLLTVSGGPDRSLWSCLRSGPVVLSFFRGEWCPFCSAELDALLTCRDALAEAGAGLVLMSPAEPSAALLARSGNRAHILRDPDLGVALRYGLVYLVPSELRGFYLARDSGTPVESNNGSWLLPIPADFVVDRDGTITLAYVQPDFTRRLDPSALVDEVRRLSSS